VKLCEKRYVLRVVGVEEMLRGRDVVYSCFIFVDFLKILGQNL
jgi:hypothetical protein